MWRYALARLGQSALTLWAVSVVVFLLVRASGDPTALMLPQDATAADVARVREALGLNDSLFQQYWTFLRNAVQGDFGTSTTYREPALHVVLGQVMPTVYLVVVTVVVVVAIAIPLGVWAATRRDRAPDVVVRSFSVVGQAIPNFWLATLLIILLSVEVPLFPSFGYGTPANYVLPVASLALFGVAGLTRLTRSSMLETLSRDYLTFARTKGASERNVVWRHALRNALVSIVTFSSLLFVSLLAGSVVVETVFAWPGVGQLALTAVKQRDFPVVQTVVILLSSVYILVNFALDLVYGLLDPRIRVAA